MLTLITGVPGHGKSLRAVWHIKRAVGEGRKVYADIDDLGIPGVEPAPKDWRDTPEGSVVVYDEAQRVFGSSGRGGGRSEREDIQAFETHRHTGHDIYLITQHPNLVHAHVRRLVGRHEHLVRIFGRNHAHIYWRDRCWEVDKASERRTANAELWSFPKDLFGCYKSATIHVSTARIPKVLKYGAVALAVLAGVAVYGFFNSSLLFGDRPSTLLPASTGASPGADGATHVVSTVPSLPVPWIGQDWAASNTIAAPAGCIASDTRCRCYSGDGQPLQLTITECQRRIREPLPYQISHTFRSSSGRSESPAVSGAPAERAGDHGGLLPVSRG